MRVLAAAAIMLALAGATFELIGGRRDARRFPPRGGSVQAGAVKLNLDCSGTQQSPTMILDSGMGVPALGWFKLRPEVAKWLERTRAGASDEFADCPRVEGEWHRPGALPKDVRQELFYLQHARQVERGLRPQPHDSL